MDCGRDAFRRNSRTRRGLSFVEFTGCLLALGSGVVLGSMYLGVDMKTMLVGILERADVIDPGFFGAEAQGGELNSLADGTGGEVSNVSSGSVGQDSSSSKRELTDQGRQAATKRYWEGLTASIQAETAHHSIDSKNADRWRLFDYLSYRRQGYQKAVKGIKALDETGVDQRLIWHGQQVLAWHQTGIELYDEAIKLLSDSPGEELTGPLAKRWESSAVQHRMEEELVREKHFSLASYLNHTFKDAAPFRPAF